MQNFLGNIILTYLQAPLNKNRNTKIKGRKEHVASYRLSAQYDYTFTLLFAPLVPHDSAPSQPLVSATQHPIVLKSDRN